MNPKVELMDDESMNLLVNYSWPGNVRQLKNFIKRAMVFCQEKVLKPKYFPEELLSFQTSTKHDSISFTSDKHYLSDQTNSERSAIIKVLDSTNWNVTQAASQLGYARTYLHRKMKN